MTPKHTLTALLVAACATLSSAATAQESVAILPSADSVFTKWGEESGWTIYADRTRNSCLIERVDEFENVVQMGVTEITSIGYMGVFTKSDIELEDGVDPVAVAFDDEIFVGTAQTLTDHLPEGYKGGYIVTDDPEFVDLVRRKYEMVVFPNQDYALIINLDGSLKAIDAARDCFAELNS